MELKTVTVGYDREMVLEDWHSHGHVVPKGFIFDGASAPRIFWAIIPPYKKTKKAACLHDWMCRNAKGKGDRLAADRLFYKMLQEAGLSSIRSRLGYVGVRLGSYMGIGVYY